MKDPLRGTHKLRPLIAQIEERMLRDQGSGLASYRGRGWYVECAGEPEVEIFLKVGFFKVDLPYFQPPSVAACERKLHLLFKPFGKSYASPRIHAPELKEDIWEIYTEVYNIRDTNANECFNEFARAVDAALEGKSSEASSDKKVLIVP
jgi:hypothetical protein